MYKAGGQQEINFRFNSLPRVFHCNFNYNIITLKKKKTIDPIRQGLQKILPQVNKNLVDLFESPPHVLANSRENNTNKSYMSYFIKWQKSANQFLEVNGTPAEE